MWKRSDTFRPFVLATIAALGSIIITMVWSNWREVPDAFNETFDLERRRARGELS